MSLSYSNPSYGIPESPSEMIRMGIYRHYKGPLYLVQGLVHDANNEGRICVLYIELELVKDHDGPRLAVRNLDSGDDPFLDSVLWPSSPGAIPRNIPRFTYLGPVLTKEMMGYKKEDVKVLESIPKTKPWRDDEWQVVVACQRIPHAETWSNHGLRYVPTLCNDCEKIIEEMREKRDGIKSESEPKP